MASALHGLAALNDASPLPDGITTHAMRMEFTSVQMTLFLFIAAMILIGLGFMAYLFVYHQRKQKPEVDRGRDDHWIWSRRDLSSSPPDLL
jgi:hypothetical protein